VVSAYLIVCLTALIGSLLTLFSGFGLGTMLLPAFALFFPLPLAITLVAIVHFLNNIFKLGLLGRAANRKVVLTFGIPSLIGAIAGAFLLNSVSNSESFICYDLFGRSVEVLQVKFVISLLLAAFVLFDLLPPLRSLKFDRKFLVPGGLLSGFFGGLSGHQGALRSAFLIQSGLSKEAFVATGVVIACMVDVTRLIIYSRFATEGVTAESLPLVASATACAFAGAFAGRKLLKKVTFSFLRWLVAAMLLVFSALMATGVI
jgi:uncharacterized membrane protein YfcA